MQLMFSALVAMLALVNLVLQGFLLMSTCDCLLSLSFAYVRFYAVLACGGWWTDRQVNRVPTLLGKSLKVLDFFLKTSGPAKSWKITLFLESLVKIFLKIVHYSNTACM